MEFEKEGLNGVKMWGIIGRGHQMNGGVGWKWRARLREGSWELWEVEWSGSNGEELGFGRWLIGG